MKHTISTLTFDFWNTLYTGDAGMDEVQAQRRTALRHLLEQAGAYPTDSQLSEAYHSAFEAYLAAWNQGRHFGAREQILYVLNLFGATASSEAIANTTKEIEDLSLEAPLQLLPGVREAIPALAAAGYKLAIISDTSLTPGRLLDQFLEADGLLPHFAVRTYSDVTGYTKPDRRMFTQTLAALEASPSQAAHIGDTPRTDIAGARAMGMLSIRYTAIADHPDPPAAHYVISDHRELLSLLGLD